MFYLILTHIFLLICSLTVSLTVCVCVRNLTDRRDDKVIESNKRFTTTSRLQLSPTPEEDYVEYSCQAKHKALQPDMPMRATVQLSVLCKYTKPSNRTIVEIVFVVQ